MSLVAVCSFFIPAKNHLIVWMHSLVTSKKM